jgi:hypothetical protein
MHTMIRFCIFILPMEIGWKRLGAVRGSLALPAGGSWMGVK